MADEIDTTPDDAGGTGDALASFVNEDEPAKPEREAAESDEDPEEGLRRAEPEKPKARPRREEPKEEDEPDKKAAKGKEEPEKPPEKRTYKHKVLGEEREIDAERLDAIAQELGVDSRELLSSASLKRASYEKMKEAAEARKQVEEARSLAKQDPAAALKLLGLDPEEYDRAAEKRVFDRYSREFGPDGQPLTPEQRELATLRAQAAERDAQAKAEQDRQRHIEEQQAAQEQERHWVKTIVGHLEKSGDPKSITPRVAQHLADAIAADASTNPADLLDDAVELAWDDVQAEHAKLYDSMPFEALEDRFPGLVKKVQQGLVAKWKAKSAGKEPERQPPEREPQRRRPRTTGNVMDDFIAGR